MKNKMNNSNSDILWSFVKQAKYCHNYMNILESHTDLVLVSKKRDLKTPLGSNVNNSITKNPRFTFLHSS